MNFAHSDNEKELLFLLTAGNEEAFTKIYQLYSKRLFGNLVKLVKSRLVAQELLQEVFIKVWNNRKTIDPEQSFRSYLFRIAENVVYDFFRKAARDHKLRQHLLSVTADQYQHIEETLLRKENREILEAAIEALPPQRKEIFRLCKVNGASYDEVSRLLGISVSTISDHIVKANKFIRQYISGDQKFIVEILVMSFFLIPRS